MFMAKDFSTEIIKWAKQGFKVVSPEQYQARFEVCKKCPLWDKDAFAGTGKCKKCGCSTRAKLSLITSKCPIDKW